MKKRLIPQVPEEVEEVFAELEDKRQQIIKKAKAEGLWSMGLDSNKELFAEVEAEARKKLTELAKKYSNDTDNSNR